MLALSAADCVSPAIQRTRDFLFRPFRWGTYLKLGLVAIITEGSAYHSRASNGGGAPSHNGPVIQGPWDFAPLEIAAVAAAVLGAILLLMWLFYLITRLRFAFFHCLVYNTREIRPGWRLYREPAWRFFWLNVVVGLCFVLLAAVLIMPFAAGIWRVLLQAQHGGGPDFTLLFSLLLPLIPLIFLLLLAGFAIDVVLRDWIMPHFAVDNATALEAWRAVWGSVRTEKRQFLVYAILRAALPAVAMALVFMVLLIPGLMVAGSIGALIYAIHTAFAGSTGGAAEAGLLVQVFFGVVAFLLMLLFGICVGGPVSTGIREYALIFYGGRYRTLGDLLYSPVTQPAPIGGPSGTRG